MKGYGFPGENWVFGGYIRFTYYAVKRPDLFGAGALGGGVELLFIFWGVFLGLVFFGRGFFVSVVLAGLFVDVTTTFIDGAGVGVGCGGGEGEGGEEDE